MWCWPLIIYIMACYMLTVDYPYLRSQAVQHTTSVCSIF